MLVSKKRSRVLMVSSVSSDWADHADAPTDTQHMMATMHHLPKEVDFGGMQLGN
jgi:hypothetical protein